MGLEHVGSELDRAIGTTWRERPLFDVGLLSMSPGAGRAFEEAGIPDLRDKPFDHGGIRPYVERHRRADWPALSEHERQTNLSAVESGERIVGAFTLPNTGRRVLIVTDAEIIADGWRHRNGTTILLPEEL